MKEKENPFNFTFVAYKVRFEKFAITRGNHYQRGVLGCSEFGGSEKGAKPDFCLSEFSYYYEHPRI